MSKQILVFLGLAAALTLSLGCSSGSNDDNIEPTVPVGGETGTNPGPTLSPSGLTVP